MGQMCEIRIETRQEMAAGFVAAAKAQSALLEHHHLAGLRVEHETPAGVAIIVGKASYGGFDVLREVAKRKKLAFRGTHDANEPETMEAEFASNGTEFSYIPVEDGEPFRMRGFTAKTGQAKEARHHRRIWKEAGAILAQPKRGRRERPASVREM
jgi:hypothetical protein